MSVPLDLVSSRQHARIPSLRLRHLAITFQKSPRRHAHCVPEVKEKISFENRHLALDREMILMNATTEDGKHIGSINWFGVHATSLPNTNTKVCSDNKGYASTYLEEHYANTGTEGYVGIFAQGTAGC